MAYLYRAVQSLKKSWSAVNGDEMLKKRNLHINNDLKAMTKAGGVGLGVVAAVMFGYDYAGNIGTVACIATGLFVLPPAVQLPVACYRAGEFDERLRLADQRRQLNQLPKPENPLI
jgi:hypothetical protein